MNITEPCLIKDLFGGLPPRWALFREAAAHSRNAWPALRHGKVMGEVSGNIKGYTMWGARLIASSSVISTITTRIHGKVDDTLHYSNMATEHLLDF